MAVVQKLKSVDDEVTRIRNDMSALFRLSARMGMTEGIDNHLTVRVPGTTDRYFINPKGLHWSEIGPDDILVVDPMGKVMEGDGVPPTSGPCIHIPIHEAHPRGNVVFHTHMPYMTALSCIRDGRLEMCHQNSVRFYKDTAYDDHFNGLATHRSEGERMAKIYGANTILFLANHGAIVTCETLGEAYDHMYFLERACMVQLIAEATGKPLHIIPQEMIEATREQYGMFTINSVKHFEAMKRLLQREGAGHAS